MGCRFDANHDDSINSSIRTIQVCTCGKHVWSIKGSRLLKADKNQCFFVNGERIDLTVLKDNNKKKYKIVATLFNLLVATGLTIATFFVLQKMNIKMAMIYI